MKLFLTSLLAFSAAQGIFAADADAGAGAVVPATGLRHGTANKHVDRRTSEYWAAPIADTGLTCVDNSIRVGGDKPAEICLTEGEALCISYDDRPMGGRWQFGIKDSTLRLYDPKGDVVWEYCRDVTHICIGEEHGFDPNQYSQERPYMTLYDEKSHEVVGSLTCDGIEGKDDKNIGQSTILKLVDQADVGPYTDYPLTIVKLRKGQTEDPTDDNSLWDIMYNPNNPQGLADFDAYFSYNQGKCVWTDLCPAKSCDPATFIEGTLKYNHGTYKNEFKVSAPKECEPVASVVGCCEYRGNSREGGGGKQCVRDGGFWFADGDVSGEDAAYHCCDPRIVEPFLQGSDCIWNYGALWYEEDDGRIPVRFTLDSYNGGAGVPFMIGCEYAAANAFVNANKCDPFPSASPTTAGPSATP